MNYTQTAGEKSTVKLTITFTEEEWKDAIRKAYVKTRGKYAVPGFRKGKAPLPVLESYYGKGVFYEEAFNALYSEHYFAILEKEKENFTAVGEPELSVEKMEEGNGVVLGAVVPVKPEVKIAKYTGLKIKKFEYNVTDGDVDKEVAKIAEKDAKLEEVTDRPAQMGDIANIDFEGSVNGEKFAGGTAEDYDLELGSGSFIPGFEEGVVGLTVGGEKDIDVTFPQNYQADDLRGKAAVFHVKLHKLTKKSYPELTDEYIKAHTASPTLEEYKAKVRERLERSALLRGRDETEGSILEAISRHTEAEIPDAMVEGEIDRIMQDFSYRLMSQGIKLDEYLKYVGATLQEFRAQYKTEAHRRVLCQLIVEKIVKTENFTAEDGEVEAKLAEQAASVEKTVEEYKKSIDPRQLEYIKNDIVVTKLFDFLTANNQMTTEDVPEEDAATADNGAAAEKPQKKSTKKTAKKAE